jgi:hypothetical protein
MAYNDDDNATYLHNYIGGIFYDVGSGSGRGVMAAVLLHHFDKCEGIEILTGLHAASEGILTEFNRVHGSGKEGKKSAHSDTKVAFHRDDLRKFDWSDGDVVFANSTWYIALHYHHPPYQC